MLCLYAKKPLMLSVLMLYVIMLSVIMRGVVRRDSGYNSYNM